MRSSYVKGLSQSQLDVRVNTDPIPGSKESSPTWSIAERQAFFENNRVPSMRNLGKNEQKKHDGKTNSKESENHYMSHYIDKGTESKFVASFSKPVYREKPDTDEDEMKLGETKSNFDIQSVQECSNHVASFAKSSPSFPVAKQNETSKTGFNKEIQRSKSAQVSVQKKKGSDDILLTPLTFRSPGQTTPRLTGANVTNSKIGFASNLKKTKTYGKRIPSRVINRNRSMERAADSSSSDNDASNPPATQSKHSGKINFAANEHIKSRKGVVRRVPVQIRNRKKMSTSNSDANEPPTSSERNMQNKASQINESNNVEHSSKLRDAQISNYDMSAAVRKCDSTKSDDKCAIPMAHTLSTATTTVTKFDFTTGEQANLQDAHRLTTGKDTNAKTLEKAKLMIDNEQSLSIAGNDKKVIKSINQSSANYFSDFTGLSSNQGELDCSENCEKNARVKGSKTTVNKQNGQLKIDCSSNISDYLKTSDFVARRKTQQNFAEKPKENVVHGQKNVDNVSQNQTLLNVKKVNGGNRPGIEKIEKAFVSDAVPSGDFRRKMLNSVDEKRLNYQNYQMLTKETDLSDPIQDTSTETLNEKYSTVSSELTSFVSVNNEDISRGRKEKRPMFSGTTASHDTSTNYCNNIQSSFSEDQDRTFSNSNIKLSAALSNGVFNDVMVDNNIQINSTYRKVGIVSHSQPLHQSQISKKQESEVTVKQGYSNQIISQTEITDPSRNLSTNKHQTNEVQARKCIKRIQPGRLSNSFEQDHSDYSDTSESSTSQSDASTHDIESMLIPKLSGRKPKRKSFSDPDRKAIISANTRDKSIPKGEFFADYNSSGTINKGQEREQSSPEDFDSNLDLLMEKVLEQNLIHGSLNQKPPINPSKQVQPPVVSAVGKDLKMSNFNSDNNLFKPISETNSPELFLTQAENQFNELLDSLKSSPVSHSKSRSEPVDVDLLQDKVVPRTRRNGVVQNSVNRLDSDVIPKESPKKIIVRQRRTLASTLPRAATTQAYEEFIKEEKKNVDTRKCVILNLLETEDSYVNSLRILVENYLRPLKQPINQNIYEPQTVDDVIFQVSQLLHHHQQLSEDIRERYEDWDQESKIGDLFVQAFKNDMLLKSYTYYIDNFANTREIINTAIDANPAFKHILEQSQRESRQGLADLMIKPIQRVPRYELIIKDLLKHTPSSHPDYGSLLVAQKDIHALAVEMNKGEKEVEIADRQSRLLQELEQLIEGYTEVLSVPKRRFIHQEICAELKATSKKDRSLWLFNDMLLCTTVKKGRGSSLRRSTMNLFSLLPGNVTVDMTNRYKFIWKCSLSELDLVRDPLAEVKLLQPIKDDLKLLNEIESIAEKLSLEHEELENVIKTMVESLNVQLDKQQVNSSVPGQANYQLPSLPGSRVEIKVFSPLGIKAYQYEFSNEESKTTFEKKFAKAKETFVEQKSKWGPTFVKVIAISKTRNGMQFSCASSNLDTSPGIKEVWVCNTDGHVGQVCFLTVDSDPQQTQCLTICNEKICCIAQVPAWNHKMVSANSLIDAISKAPLGKPLQRRRSSSSSDPALKIIAFDESDQSDEEVQSPYSTLGSVNSVSSYDLTGFGSEMHLNNHGAAHRIPQNPFMKQLLGNGAPKKAANGNTLHGSLEGLLNEVDEPSPPEPKDVSGTMWIGTEEGKINVFSTSEPVRASGHIALLSHSASVLCILYHFGQVFVALSNGDLIIYQRDLISGQWQFNSKKCIPGTSLSSPITKMIIVNENELWCGCKNEVRIFSTKTHDLKNFFPAINDRSRQIFCMVTSGHGVWIALDKHPIIKLFHSVSCELIKEIDTLQAVNTMLASSDAIIRQHKVACLRITSLLTSKNLLWAGTSAGVILTMALPTITSNSNTLPGEIEPQCLPYGHTGHVRFLTSVDVEESNQPNRGYKKPNAKNRNLSSSGVSKTSTLVISGGDGYEDFDRYSTNEIAGREDSTNHLLVWKL